MNKILRQIANTIVANLGNTEPIGLFDGKIGISLFLYKYARYSGCEAYEDIASCLIDDVFKQLKPNMSPSVIDGLAGIGYGLNELLKDGFLEKDPEDDILRDVDEALLRNVKLPLMKEISFPIPLYSSGIYLLSRLSSLEKNIESAWITGVIENAQSILAKNIHKEKCMLNLSLLNSMLHIFCGLYDQLETDKKGIEIILKDILSLSNQIIREKNFKEVDLLLVGLNIEKLPLNLKIECTQTTEAETHFNNLSNDDLTNIWFDNMWWCILYETSLTKEEIFIRRMEEYTYKKIQESFYNEMDINSKLAAVGLWLISR